MVKCQVEYFERSVASQCLAEVVQEVLIYLQMVQAEHLELIVLGKAFKEGTERTEELDFVLSRSNFLGGFLVCIKNLTLQTILLAVFS